MDTVISAKELQAMKDYIAQLEGSVKGSLQMIWCLAKQNGGQVRVEFSTWNSMPHDAQIHRHDELDTRSVVFTAIEPPEKNDVN